MDNTGSRSLKNLKQKLQAIECQSTLSPSLFTPSDLDVSGFAILDDDVSYLAEDDRSWRRSDHSSPESMEAETEPRARHASFSGAGQDWKRISDFPMQMNFNGGLTLPTSASKKKSGMRSYSSTPDCKHLVGDAPPVIGADETGLRKRSLGKARRVLRNADAVSPRDQDETDKNTGTIAGPGQNDSSLMKDPRMLLRMDESLGPELPKRHSLGTINEYDDLVLNDLNNDDLILADMKTDANVLNVSFTESRSLSIGNLENINLEKDSDEDLHQESCLFPLDRVEKQPLQELSMNQRKKDGMAPNTKSVHQFDVPPKAPNKHTFVPTTPLQRGPVSHGYTHQQEHFGLKTPLQGSSMQPPIGMFTPAQPSHPTYSRKQKFVHVNQVPYQLVRQIGSGGSCKVHQAADFEKHQLVAIKVVDLDEVDEAMIESYKNEITLLKKLQHSNRVVKLLDYEFSRADNLLHIVMECGDCDLATIFNERQAKKSITPNLIRFYWEEMLSCIEVIHAEDIVHSDLKPANFLSVNGTLKLIDFGIANAIQSDKTSVTRDSQIGTLNYMSPEAILDTQPAGSEDDDDAKPRIKIGTKSDVWSLGCILYSMVYSKTPFHHLSNQLTKIQAIINPRILIKFPDNPSFVNPNLIDVLQKCLTRDPKSRPSVHDLLNHSYVRQ